MRLRSSPARAVVSADMLPILNIVLLLLGFFLILARSAPAPSVATLPRSVAGAERPAAAPQLVVRADGALELDGRAVTEPELVAALRARRAPLLQLRADASLPARRALELVRLAAAAEVGTMHTLVRGGCCEQP